MILTLLIIHLLTDIGSDDERGLIQWKQLSKRDELSATYDYSKLNQLYGFPLIGKLQPPMLLNLAI